MSNPVKTNIDVRPIVIGAYPLDAKKTIAQDAGGVIPANAVLGEITLGDVAALADGGNTGNGTSSAVTKLAGAKLGVYTVIFTAATVFYVLDPDGFRLADGATGSAYANDLAFTITAGGTAFVAGDRFTLTVAAGSGKLKRSVAASVDGSQYPKYFPTRELNAVAGDLTSVQVLRRAEVRSDGLVFTGSETLATVVPGTGGKTFRDLLIATDIIPIDGQTIGRFDN